MAPPNDQLEATTVFDDVLSISMQSPAQIILSETLKLAVGCANAERLINNPNNKGKTFIVRGMQFKLTKIKKMIQLL